MFARDYVIVAQKLEQGLIEKGWSLADLAWRAEMTERRIQDLMKGDKRVPRATPKRIADKFGVKPDYLRASVSEIAPKCLTTDRWKLTHLIGDC